MLIKWSTPINSKQSLLFNLLNKLETSLWLRREECKKNIQTLSWDKIKIWNKRTWEVIRRG